MLPVKSFDKKNIIENKNANLTGLASMTFVKPTNNEIKKQASVIDEYLFKLSEECKQCIMKKVKVHKCHLYNKTKGEK
jgi:hypothetical protein